MRRIIIFCLVVCLCVACKHKTKPSYLPKDKFKEILIEIHLIDGYYMMHYNHYLNVKDSTSFYKQVFERNGVTRAQFDSSLFYYGKNPKKYDEIYDEIITEFNKMNQDISDIRTLIMDSAKNLYKGRSNIQVIRQGYTDKLPFEIAIKDTGLYTITVQLQVFDDDYSKNVRLTAYSTCKDCKTKNERNYFDRVEYKKTSQLKIYKVSKRIKDRSQNIIKGWILDQDDQKTKFHRHVTVKWIFVNRAMNIPKPVDQKLPKNQKKVPGLIKHVP